MNTHRFDLGDYQVVVVRDDELHWPIDDVLGPSAEGEARQQAAEEHGVVDLEQVELGINHLLVMGKDLNVLIDAGSGQRPWPGGNEGKLHDNLRSMGVEPSDVDGVAITHSDYDHIGGIFDSRGHAEFPEASHYLSSNSWTYWATEQARSEIAELHGWPEERIDYVWDTYSSLGDRLQIVDYGEEFLPGFEFVPAIGHRYDNDAVRIVSGGEVLFDLGDSIIHPMVISHDDWYFTYDVDPAKAVETKKELLERCRAEDALVFGTHFPFPGIGRVSRSGRGYSWHPA